MRALFLAPIGICLAAAAGLALCRAAGWQAHPTDLLIAAGAALLATAAGAVPLLLTRKSDQAVVAQAGLVATMLHMFVAVAIAGAVILIAKPGQPFTYWMFWFYGVTLIAVAAASVRIVSSAPLARPGSKQ